MIDILVNNAGIGSSTNPKPVADFNDEFWELTALAQSHRPVQAQQGGLAAHAQAALGAASSNIALALRLMVTNGNDDDNDDQLKKVLMMMI